MVMFEIIASWIRYFDIFHFKVYRLPLFFAAVASSALNSATIFYFIFIFFSFCCTVLWVMQLKKTITSFLLILVSSKMKHTLVDKKSVISMKNQCIWWKISLPMWLSWQIFLINFLEKINTKYPIKLSVAQYLMKKFLAQFDLLRKNSKH